MPEAETFQAGWPGAPGAPGAPAARAVAAATAEEDDEEFNVAIFAGLPDMVQMVKLNFPQLEKLANAQRARSAVGGGGPRPLAEDALGTSFVSLPQGSGETKRSLSWLAVGYDRRFRPPVDGPAQGCGVPAQTGGRGSASKPGRPSGRGTTRSTTCGPTARSRRSWSACAALRWQRAGHGRAQG